MKRLFILSFVCLFAYITKSQETGYLPFIEDGKVWKVGHFPGSSTYTTEVLYYTFGNDIVIAGKKYKKWMCRSRGEQSEQTTSTRLKMRK